MIFLMSYLGSDLRSVLTSPTKLIIAAIIIIVIWAVGKFVEKQLNKKVERDLREIDFEKKRQAAGK